MMNKHSPARPTVLLVSYADQHFEAYAPPGVDIHFTRLPWGVVPPQELDDQEVIRSLLPKRYQQLYQADCLRRNGTTRPLTPNVLEDSERVKKWINVLNQLPQLPTGASEEMMTWTM